MDTNRSAGIRHPTQPRFSCQARFNHRHTLGRTDTWIVFAPQGFPFCEIKHHLDQTETPEVLAAALVALLNLKFQETRGGR